MHRSQNPRTSLRTTPWPRSHLATPLMLVVYAIAVGDQHLTEKEATFHAHLCHSHVSSVASAVARRVHD